MSRISFGARRMNDWCVEHKREQDRLRAPETKAIERIAHPTIPTPSRRCYRVIRRYTISDRSSLEDIGAFTDPALAMRMLTREAGRAQVLDPDGKVYADNLRDMERR